ncbi:Putative ribonuclease H protein At1g65750, partial [Linum grandiflorum]
QLLQPIGNLYNHSRRDSWCHVWATACKGFGILNVQLQLDSTTAISTITSKDSSDLRHRACIEKAREFLSRDWLLSVIHTFREGNRAANLLAHHGHSLRFGFHSVSTLLREVNDYIRTDSVSVFFSH